jgi:DNA primase
MTDDNIKEVINRTSIVEVINSTVSLKKKGNNYFGLSPFKSEKTPSFSVNEEKKIFHCFSTGEHGNVIDFLIKVKGYSFKDALHELANKAGVELSYKSSKINNMIYEVNNFAADLFHKNLLNFKPHIDYLKSKRKFSEDIINHFLMGSTANFSTIQKKLLSEFAVTDLVAAGLFNKNQNSKLFFMNRIMVPIINLQNRTLGFGARVIDQSLPKYINTSETKVFKKKQILFNEKILNKHTNKTLILVEGYFDVIKLYQNGFQNCIAPLGTAINQDKLIELTKKGFEIIVCLDGDTAGRNASIRLMNNLLASENFELGIKFVLLPKDYDPDLLLDSNLKDQLNKLIEHPLNIEQLIEKYLEKYNNSKNIDEKFKGSKILKSLLSSVANKDLKKILNDYFRDIKKSQNIKQNKSSSAVTQIEFKNDLKSKFSAALIIFFIENLDSREKVFDLIATAKFDKKFKEIRDQIIKKTLFKSTSAEIYDLLDSKGLNFTKNLLFSNEVRRLCRFASPSFKGDPYNEIEKTINFINI